MTRLSYKRYRFSPKVIAHALWLYHRCPLSLRHVEEMQLAQGVQVSYETICRWSRKFSPELARTVRRRAPQRGDVWHLDELQVKMGGKPFVRKMVSSFSDLPHGCGGRSMPRATFSTRSFP